MLSQRQVSIQKLVAIQIGYIYRSFIYCRFQRHE